MKPIDKPGLGAIILAHAAVDMQTVSLAVVLPLLLTRFSLNYASAAVIVTMNQVVLAIAQPLFGIFGDRRAIPWLALAGCALCGIAMVSVLFLPGYWMVIIAVALSGLGSALFHPEGLAHARRVSGDHLVTGTSYFFLGGNIGFGLGPLLSSFLVERFGPVGALGMLVPTAFGCALLWHQRGKYLRVIAARRADAPRSAMAPAVVRVVAFLMLLIVLRSLATEGMKTFIPLYFSEVTHKSASEFAPMLTTMSLSGILGTLFSGNIADRIGRRITMVGAMAIALAALLVFQRVDGLLQLVALGVFGMAMTAPWTLTVTMVQDAMPDNLGLAGGLTLGTAYGASGLGVGMLGLLANSTGLAFTMQVIGWIPAVVLVLSVLVPDKRRALQPAVSPA